MRWRWLGVDRQRGAIFLVVFRRVGLGIGEVQKFELLGVVEKYRWSNDGVNISLQDLLHCFHFSDMSLKVRHVGKASG